LLVIGLRLSGEPPNDLFDFAHGPTAHGRFSPIPLNLSVTGSLSEQLQLVEPISDVSHAMNMAMPAEDRNRAAERFPNSPTTCRSGNPAGRLLGTKNRATKAAEALLDGEAEALTRKAVELALAGDTVALKLCLERLLPPRKSRRVTFDLPTIQTEADLLPAFAAVVNAMGSGELAPD
jgi:hypothetical protein